MVKRSKKRYIITEIGGDVYTSTSIAKIALHYGVSRQTITKNINERGYYRNMDINVRVTKEL